MRDQILCEVGCGGKKSRKLTLNQASRDDLTEIADLILSNHCLGWNCVFQKSMCGDGDSCHRQTSLKDDRNRRCALEHCIGRAS